MTILNPASAIAVSLTVLGHKFDCAVFSECSALSLGPSLTIAELESQGACNSTFRFALFMEYMLAVVCAYTYAACAPFR